jgi:hypothetical protein
MGLDIAIEALKDCLRQRKATINEIYCYAKLPREQCYPALHGGAMTDLAASIRAHLFAFAQNKGEDPTKRVLVRHAVERFLHRPAAHPIDADSFSKAPCRLRYGAAKHTGHE